MREIRTSGLMSGEGKRAIATAQATAPFLDSTPDAPTLASSPRRFYRPDRAMTKPYPLAMVAKEPGHQGERAIRR
jgi:hypothetical protein